MFNTDLCRPSEVAVATRLGMLQLRLVLNLLCQVSLSISSTKGSRILVLWLTIRGADVPVTLKAKLSK